MQTPLRQPLPASSRYLLGEQSSQQLDGQGFDHEDLRGEPRCRTKTPLLLEKQANSLLLRRALLSPLWVQSD